jgi:site-specific DNA recombinase
MTIVASSTPPRVIVYTRVSTAGQEEEGTSLTTQEQRCRAYCDERGWTVADIYSDTYSGASLYDRRGLSALRQAVRNGVGTIVLSYAIDRLSRSQAHLAVLMDDFSRHGARLEFVSETLEDSAVGRFVLAARSFAAEVEREKIQERTTRGIRGRVEQGKLMGSRAPYGYRWTGDDRSRLEIAPEQATVVRRIFTSLAAGGTQRGLAGELSRDGIPTPWRAKYWMASTIHTMVSNPVYVGRPVGLRYERTINAGGRTSSRKRAEAQTVELPLGVAPAIIDEATFAAVADHRARNRLEARRGLSEADAERFLLRGGYVRCGHCGFAMGVLTDLRTDV